MEVVAQLVRALVCGAGGRGFETHHPPQNVFKIKKCSKFNFRTLFLVILNNQKSIKIHNKIKKPFQIFEMAFLLSKYVIRN